MSSRVKLLIKKCVLDTLQCLPILHSVSVTRWNPTRWASRWKISRKIPSRWSLAIIATSYTFFYMNHLKNFEPRLFLSLPPVQIPHLPSLPVNECLNRVHTPSYRIISLTCQDEKVTFSLTAYQKKVQFPWPKIQNLHKAYSTSSYHATIIEMSMFNKLRTKIWLVINKK